MQLFLGVIAVAVLVAGAVAAGVLIARTESGRVDVKRPLLYVVLPLAALGAAGAVGWAIGNHGSTSTPSTPAVAEVDPHVAAGAHDFVQFACAQCHGALGRGGVSPAVPELTTVGKTLTAAALQHIINHGLGVASNPTKPYMPVWGAVISSQQVNDLVSYIRAGLPAVAGAEPVTVPAGQGAVVAGAALYQRYGCVDCHGPNGLGGVPNPASPDKTIPPLSGADFKGEFNTYGKIASVIMDGSVLGRAPIVSMPHWRGIIPPAQLRQIVAYIKTLK